MLGIIKSKCPRCTTKFARTFWTWNRSVMFVYSIILPIKHTVFSSQQLFSALSAGWTRWLFWPRKRNDVFKLTSTFCWHLKYLLIYWLSWLITLGMELWQFLCCEEKVSTNFFGVNLVFSISFVVIRDGVLGHSDLISGERYLTIKYAFAHNEMLTVRNLLVKIYSFVSTPNWEMFAVQVFRSYVNYRSVFSTALISKGGKHIKASISRMWRILSLMLLIDGHVNE